MMLIRLVSAALDTCNRNQVQVCSLEQRQLLFFSVSLSVLHWIDECRGSSNPCMLCGLPRLCLKDNLQTVSLIMPTCTPNYSVCLDLKRSEENISSRCSIEIVLKWNLQNAEKPTPTPFLSMPSQAETSASSGVSLIPVMLVGSLSASDRMHTEISCLVTGGAPTTLSNSL